MSSGQIEYEHGVPIPGVILPEPEWARTAVKRLPEAGPLDWPVVFGRRAPVVLELGCGNGRFTLASAVERPGVDHFAIDILPVVIRYATRRANQRGLHHVRFAVKDAQTFLRGTLPRPRSRRSTSIIRSRIATRAGLCCDCCRPDWWRRYTVLLCPAGSSSCRQIIPITGNT